MKKFIHSIIFFSTAIVAGNWEDSPYFDTKFLKEYDQVRKDLIENDQFQEGDFNTEDNVRIHYLWKQRENAKKTLICCSGYSPGRKEGVASLYPMMPDDTNIMLFDARGTGQSDGKYWNIWQYGLNEYKDITGAIACAEKKDDCPIIVWGICSGAFNTVHAIRHLAQQKKLHRVKGIVCDSSWASLQSTSYHVPVEGTCDEIRKNIYKKFGKNNISTAMAYSCTGITRLFLSLIYYGIWQHLISGYEKTTTLFGKMQDIPIPVFFIHSEDDTYAKIEETTQLAQEKKDVHTWWITKPSKHACNHLKHKKEYRERLLNFVNYALQDEN